MAAWRRIVFMSVLNARAKALIISVCLTAIAAGCSSPASNGEGQQQTMLKAIAAVNLAYVFEADVPAPDASVKPDTELRDPQVQADFDNNRPDEMLSRTIMSPDKKAIFAVYRKMNDAASDPTGLEYRIDAYSPEGALIRKVSTDEMAVYYPETIVWSPDSSTIAFVAKHRSLSLVPTGTPLPAVAAPNAEGELPDANTAAPAASPTHTGAAANSGVLTFSTEQIYLCNASGEGLRPITQNDGLVYFYYVWSPDSSMLAALASTKYEWTFQLDAAEQKGEEPIPSGRPRIVEKNGRERRLDDYATYVKPVWSPDGSKVALGFGTQVRIYDALGTSPTQAAIPLKTQLLLSSQTYDKEMLKKLQSSDAANSNADANANARSNTNTAAASPTPADQSQSTLPDEKMLASYNPVIEVLWPQDDTIYLMTAYIKRMKNEVDSRTSYARWHRLLLSPQASALPVR